MDITQEILSEITIFNKYAKYYPEIKRRESWEEICERNAAMHIRSYPKLKAEIQKVYKEFVKTKKVLPSMRSMQFGGKAVELSNARIFNCAFLPIDSPIAFSETMFLLLSGCGVGYSVQKRNIEKMPIVSMKAYFYRTANPVFDYRDIRPKGARLITSGGKAPGPDPLRICIEKIREILEYAKGRNLKSIEAHDIQCHIADAVLSGGIRRAAMIALFDMDDYNMLTCKGQVQVDNWELTQNSAAWHGFCIYKGKRHDVVISSKERNRLLETGKLPWYHFEQQRGRANNSVMLLRSEVTEEQFQNIWKLVKKSHAGEPGVYWTNDLSMGANPCVDVALRPFQFCNLTEMNASDIDGQEDLNARAKAAAFIGTLQAGYTDFHYLRSIWKDTTEEEALIGVSMTGIASGKVLGLDLEEAVKIVVAENARVAALIGINPAARCTNVKPAGTTSLVLGCASGIHSWHAEHYIRRMRVGKNEALYKYIQKQLPDIVEDCKHKPTIEAVLSFPQKAPDEAILRNESYLDLLNRVLRFNQEWVTPGHQRGVNKHNVSCTISLKDDEWEECGKFMWEHRNEYNGIAVVPYDGGTYVQAPFEDITKETFDEMVKHLHNIDLTQVIEEDDLTSHSLEAACAGGACEVAQ